MTGVYCSNCRWWKQTEIKNRSEIFGECHYWAPLGETYEVGTHKKEGVQLIYVWPCTEADGYCSRYCRIERKPPKLRTALVVLEDAGMSLDVE